MVLFDKITFAVFFLSHLSPIAVSFSDPPDCNQVLNNCRASRCESEAACTRRCPQMADCLAPCRSDCLQQFRNEGSTNSYPDWPQGGPYWMDAYAGGPPSDSGAADCEDEADDCFESCLMPCIVQNRPTCYSHADSLTGGGGRARASARAQCGAGTNSWFRQRCQSERDECINQCGVCACEANCYGLGTSPVMGVRNRIGCVGTNSQCASQCSVERHVCGNSDAIESCLNNDGCSFHRAPMPGLMRTICQGGCNFRATLNAGCQSACELDVSCLEECREEYNHECQHGMQCTFEDEVTLLENEVTLLEDEEIKHVKKSCGDSLYQLDFVVGKHLFYLATPSNDNNIEECSSYIFHSSFDTNNLGKEEMLKSSDISDIFSTNNENVITLGKYLLGDIIESHEASAFSSTNQPLQYDLLSNNCGDYIANLAKNVGHVFSPSESKTIATLLLKENPELSMKIKSELKTINNWLFASVAGWSDEDFVMHLVQQRVKKMYVAN